jgi:hypothetical protein
MTPTQQIACYGLSATASLGFACMSFGKAYDALIEKKPKKFLLFTITGTAGTLLTCARITHMASTIFNHHKER